MNGQPCTITAYGPSSLRRTILFAAPNRSPPNRSLGSVVRPGGRWALRRRQCSARVSVPSARPLFSRRRRFMFCGCAARTSQNKQSTLQHQIE